MGKVTTELLASLGEPRADEFSQARAWETQPQAAQQIRQNCNPIQFREGAFKFIFKETFIR